MRKFARVCKILTLLSAIALSLEAQTTTTITGALRVATDDAVSGTLTITLVSVSSSASGERVLPGSETVGFTGGQLSVALLPTDTMTPVLQTGSYKYRVTYAIPSQTVSGHRVGSASFGPCYWVVPTSATPVDVGQVESCSTNIIAPVQSIAWSQIQQSGAGVGQAPCWNGSAWMPGNCVTSGYSMDLLLPSVSDSGALQKTEDKVPYTISAVSCSTDKGTVQVNLDVRTVPNTPGANVLASPAICNSTAQTVIFVNPGVTVPLGSPVALDILAVTTDGTGTPGVVRVNVSR